MLSSIDTTMFLSGAPATPAGIQVVHQSHQLVVKWSTSHTSWYSGGARSGAPVTAAGIQGVQGAVRQSR